MIHFYSQKAYLPQSLKRVHIILIILQFFKKMEKHINNKKSRMNLLLIYFSMFHL